MLIEQTPAGNFIKTAKNSSALGFNSKIPLGQLSIEENSNKNKKKEVGKVET